MTDRSPSAIPSVRLLLPADVDVTIAYQKYYLLGLDRLTRLEIDGGPLVARLAPGVENKIRLMYRAARRRPLSGGGHGVGRYRAQTARDEIPFALDARDTREIDEEALTGSDVYFKANRWAGVDYDSKVVPLVNGNGLLGSRQIAHLKELRTGERPVDVAFISNVWGGREHNIRLFEALAGLECRKDLRAIFFRDWDPDLNERYMARLRERGVECTYDPLPPRELWARLAQARVVMIRPGKHLCVPWRMLDLLCMGACIAFDSTPPPRWPEPFVDGVHYVDCGLRRPRDMSPADPSEYEKVATAIEALLRDPDRQARLRAAAGRYFDLHAAPDRVAESILSRLDAAVRQPRP
jgi:glycosyltransferase involved in cell wall biosynthesis